MNPIEKNNNNSGAIPEVNRIKATPSKKKVSKTSPDLVIPKKSPPSVTDQELLILERDDFKRHSRELSQSLAEYSKKIGEVQAKNRRLEEELSMDEQILREDPFFNDNVSGKLSDLYTQGNNIMVRLELERKEIGQLNKLIQQSEDTLAQQKAKLYELSALDHNHSILLSRIRKMENDIDRKIVKMNEKLAVNRKLRESIDAHRNERGRMDVIFTKIHTETMRKTHKLARLTEEVQKIQLEVQSIEDEIEQIRLDGEDFEEKCDQKATIVLKELKEIALQQKNSDEHEIDPEKYTYLGENDLMKNLSIAQENMLRSRVSRSRWKAGQAKAQTDVMLTKYQENRNFIEKIHQASGTTTVSEMIEAFNRQETEHFERIQQVNQLAQDIENHRLQSAKLREEIGRLKQRKDSMDFQKISRIEGLKARLQSTQEQKKHKEEANTQLHNFLSALTPTIQQLHTRIGCRDPHNDMDLKKRLGEIEEKIVSILQKYHAKLQSKKHDDSASIPDDISTSSIKISMKDFGPSTLPSDPALTPLTQQGSSVQPMSSTGERHASAIHGLFGTPYPFNIQDFASTPSSPIRWDLSNPSGQNNSKGGGETFKNISAFLSKDQPFRYTGLRPPHLSTEELKRKDGAEEEYPLTYDELKHKVWRKDNSRSQSNAMDFQ